jgi:uroporphyrin-3 C-methyltransferase
MAQIGEHVEQQVAVVPTSQSKPIAENNKPVNELQQQSDEVEQQIAVAPTTQHNKSVDNLQQQPEEVEQQIAVAPTTQHNKSVDDLQQQLEELAQKIQPVSAKQQQNDALIAELNNKISELTKNVELQNAQLTTLKPAFDATLAEIKQEVMQVSNINNKAEQDWMLQEVHYLLNLVQYRLDFMQDVKTASHILKTAKDKLQKWQQPQLTQPLIAQIEQDINTLQTIQQWDTVQIAQKLSNYINQVPQLSLVKTATPPPAKPQPIENTAPVWTMLDSWGDVGSVVWREIKQFISISHNENVDAGLLDNTQIFFIQESLRLKLESARLALLKADFHTLQTALTESNAWLQQYYDQSAIQVVEMQIGLQQLQKIDFSINYPDMTTAQNILQRINIQWIEHFVETNE